MAELRRYVDQSGVEVLVNPDALVCVVFPPPEEDPDREPGVITEPKAVILLAAGQTVVVTDPDGDRLRHRVVTGDPRPAPEPYNLAERLGYPPGIYGPVRTVASDRHIVLLNCGHWQQTGHSEADSWGCETDPAHGYQPAAEVISAWESAA